MAANAGDKIVIDRILTITIAVLKALKVALDVTKQKS